MKYSTDLGPNDLIGVPTTLWERLKCAWAVITRRAGVVFSLQSTLPRSQFLEEFCEPLPPEPLDPAS